MSLVRTHVEDGYEILMEARILTIYDMLDAEIVDFCDKLFRKQGFILG